jgi:Cu-processing system permease protein
MERRVVAAIAAKELRTGIRNRWFVLYAVIFMALSIGFSMLAMGGSTLTGQPGFGRTSAGLLNLMTLMVPLIGLTIGAQSLVAERQDRNLDYLLAQPVSPREVYVGKYLGAAAALVLLLLLGFGVAGIMQAVKGTAAGLADYLVLILLTILLGLAMLSAGYLVSSRSPQTAVALGIALSLWLGLVVVGDLGLMSTAIVMSTLLALTLINPLDVYKLLGVDLLQTSLDVLGPAGTYARQEIGSALTLLLALILVAWIVLPLPVGYRLFLRKDIQ